MSSDSAAVALAFAEDGWLVDGAAASSGAAARHSCCFLIFFCFLRSSSTVSFSTAGAASSDASSDGMLDGISSVFQLPPLALWKQEGLIMPFAKVPWSDAVIKFQFSTGFDVAGLQQRTVISPH